MTVSVHEAKTQLSKLLDLLEEGEEIVIQRHGHAVAAEALDRAGLAGSSEDKGAEATLAAVRIRFRPVIMTSLAFFFGTLPLALSAGAGAGARRRGRERSWRRR